MYKLSNALTIDINVKKRGQITINSRLTADEIYDTLCKLPQEKISQLSPNYKWLHWIAHAPLFAELQSSYNKQKALKLGQLLESPENFLIGNLSFSWHNKLATFGLNHYKAGFLWALCHQIFPGQRALKYVIELPSGNLEEDSSPEALTVKEFEGTYFPLIYPARKVLKCLEYAVDAKIPTAQEELDLMDLKH